LCTALVTYFVHFSRLWTKCLRHFVYCLDLGRGTAPESLDDALSTEILVAKLDRRKLRLAIWFATTLVEEVGSSEFSQPSLLPCLDARLIIHSAPLHESLVKNAPDVLCLLARGFSPPDDTPTIKVQGDALACFQVCTYSQPWASMWKPHRANSCQAWILYAQRTSQASDLVSSLRQLVGPAINCFADDELFQPTAELFSDALSNYSSFFTNEHYATLAALFESEWAAAHYQRLLHGNHAEDGIAFGLLLLAYGDAKVQDLMRSTDPRSQQFLEKLSGLLAADGYLVGEDSIFVPALEFWSTFIETMIDTTYSEEEETQGWKPFAEQHLKMVVMNSWRKIRWPPPDEFASWDSADRVAFSDARKDVADMLQSVFTLEGSTLVAFFADLFLQALAAQSWAELEATAFCLGALDDCSSDGLLRPPSPGSGCHSSPATPNWTHSDRALLRVFRATRRVPSERPQPPVRCCRGIRPRRSGG
jgi:hypothetical protein